ncbi:MAG: acyltransferase family protein [Limisphaerales bacterium]
MPFKQLSMTPGLRTQSTSRIPELDGIRGLAILMVVCFHYCSGLSGRSALAIFANDVISFGWTGVDLFFVLSGFLIGGMLIDHRDSGGYFKTFYIRRVCRIWPVYFLWIGAFLALRAALSSQASSSWYSETFVPIHPFWNYFLFLQNFWMKFGAGDAPWTSVTWSLCIEEQFYLVMPLIIWIVSPRKLPALLATLVALVFLYRCYLDIHSRAYVYVLTSCRVDSLIIGVLCAWLVRNPRLENLIRRRCDWLYLIFVILSCGMAYFVFSRRGGDANSFDVCTWGFTWIALFYASLLLLAITDKSGWLGRFMRNPLLRHFATISYCVYLIHMQVLTFINFLFFHKLSIPETNFTNGLAIVLGLPTTWLLAVSSWIYVERPIIEWGHSFRYGNCGRLKQNRTESLINPGS